MEGLNNKIYTCTIEAANSCYIQTLLVFAESEEEAREKVKHFHDPRGSGWRVKYVRGKEPKELVVDGDVIKVGHGANYR